MIVFCLARDRHPVPAGESKEFLRIRGCRSRPVGPGLSFRKGDWISNEWA